MKIAPYHYINLLVLAKALQSLIYIILPGTVGIGMAIDTIITLYTFHMMHKCHIIPKFKEKKHILFWFVALIMGFIQSLTTNLSGGSYTSFMVALLEQINILFIFAVLDIEYVFYFLKAFIHYFIPLGLISAFFWEGYQNVDTPHIMNHFCLFAVILFYFPKKYSVIIVFALLFALFVDSSVRACLLSTVVSIFFAVVCRFLSATKFSIFARTVHMSLYFLPIILVILGYTGVFNVFQYMEDSNSNIELGGKKGDAGRSSTVDSRTVVYIDAIMNINNTKDLVLGHGPAYRIQTYVGFQEGSSELIEGRGNMESGILNILLFYGLLGCFAFYCLCHKSSLNAIKSKNSFMKLVALFVAYKFLYSFIEDSSINFTTYIAIGMCLNERIRNLSDSDIKNKFLHIANKTQR